MKKKRFLRFASVLLIAVLLLSLCGCGGGDSADNPAKLSSGGNFSSWFGEGKKLSKKESGTFYFKLEKDIKVDKQGVIEGQNVIVDLNGYSITGSQNRIFSLGENASLTLLGGTVASAGADAHGGVIAMEGAGAELVLENVTLSNTDDSHISERLCGGVIYANTPAEGAAAKVIIRGETTVNGSASGLRRNGGAMTLLGNTELYMYGGTVQGGQAGTSGNIHLDGKSVFYFLGGEIRDGIAVSTSEITGFGGNIYSQSMARIYMYGGTVSGGQAHNNGGNIFLSNTAAVEGESGLYLYEGEIRDGVAKYEGGNLYAGEAHSVVRMYGGTVKNGNASMGGNIFLQDSAMELRGGLLDAKPDSTDLFAGGNIYAAQAVLKIYDGVVENGIVQNHGGNIYVVDTDVDIYGGIIRNGTTVVAEVGKGGANFYAGRASVVNLYGGEIYGGTANSEKDQDSSAAGANVMIGGTTRMQMFGGTVKDGTIYGKVTRGGGIYVYGQVAKNDTVFHMYGGVVENGRLENTMRGMCIASYSETSGDTGFAIARIFDGEVIFTGANDDPDRLHTIYGNKTSGRDVRIFDDTNYKGLYRRTTVGACKDASHNTVTGEVAATCLTHGYTQYTCATCGDWCKITAQPTGHTEQTETVTAAEAVSYTKHSCTACDQIWITQVDVTAALQK